MKNIFSKFMNRFFYTSQSTGKENFVYILTWFYLIPFGAVILLNTICSSLQTAYMNLYEEVEKPLYKDDSPILLILLTLFFLIFFICLFKRMKLSSRFCKMLRFSTCIYSVVLCLLILYVYRVGVACDSGHISNIAINILNGDYSSFQDSGYMGHYPHQTGILALVQAVYAIFGTENYVVLQLINIAAITAAVYYLQKIAEELFADLKVQFLTAILCITCLPLHLFSTFIYGDIPGLGLVVPVIYYVIRYLHTGNKKLLIPSSILIMFAVVIKNNNSVILVASVIILLLHGFSKKDWFAFLFAAVLILAPALGTNAVDTYYTKAGNLDKFPSGIPKLGWIAMGLQTNDYLENGWYNGYNWNIYTENNYDTEATKAACIESIKDSFAYFIRAPRSNGLAFFYNKFISQWNSPNYNALIILEWYSRYSENQPELAKWLIYEDGRFILENIMNFHQFLTLFGTSVFAVRGLKKWSLGSAYLALCIFGGYCFHVLLWEAGGRYGLGYFVLCIPLAAYGLSECIRLLQGYFHSVRTDSRP